MSSAGTIPIFLAWGVVPLSVSVVSHDPYVHLTHYATLLRCLPFVDQDPEHPAFCLSHVLQSPQMWLGITLGGILTMMMLMYRIRGAIIIGILIVSIISWPRHTPVTLFPDTEVGNEAYHYFSKVVGFYPLRKVGNAANFDYGNGKIWTALITFLYVDLFDTTG